MEKYTAKDVIEQRICFKPMTEEQFNKIKERFHTLYPDKIGYRDAKYKRSTTYYKFYPNTNSKDEVFNHMERSFVNASGISTGYWAEKEISFEQFDFEEVIPTEELNDMAKAFGINFKF